MQSLKKLCIFSLKKNFYINPIKNSKIRYY